MSTLTPDERWADTITSTPDPAETVHCRIAPTASPEVGARHLPLAVIQFRELSAAVLVKLFVVVRVADAFDFHQRLPPSH